MASDVQVVQSALRQHKKLKRNEEQSLKAQEIAKRKDFFLLQLRPAILHLFVQAFSVEGFGKDNPNRIRIKYVGFRRQLVIRINNQRYGQYDRDMNVWITFGGEVVTRRKFWAIITSGGYSGGGIVFPAGIRIIPAVRKSCDLDRSTQEAICEDVMARIRAM